jgi:hypothetical protein
MSHDVFNASSTATWIECPWSALNAVPDAPKKESTILAAETGTEKHEDMEGGSVPDVEAFLRQLEPGTLEREVRVRVADNCGGTIDIRNLNPRITTLLDGKFGKWDVAAMHNMQLFTYAASSLKDTTAEWFRFVIFQPDGLDDEPWKQWVHHRSEVEAHRDRVLRVINERTPPRPGPWCRWCNAFQVCPAMNTDAGFVMGAMARDPASLTVDELVRLVRIIRALDDVKSVYEDVLTARLKMGYVSTLGAVLKPSRSYRSWNDAQQAAEYGYQNYGAKGVRPLTPAQLEKMGPAGKSYAIVGAHKPEGQLKAVY